MDVFGFVHRQRFKVNHRDQKNLKPAAASATAAVECSAWARDKGPTSSRRPWPRDCGRDAVGSGVKVADEAVPWCLNGPRARADDAGEAVQSLDSLALEIRGLLGSLRALAGHSTDATVSADERSVIQDEFSMIQARHARITRPTGSVLACDDGLGQADAMTRLTPQALGVSDASRAS